MMGFTLFGAVTSSSASSSVSGAGEECFRFFWLSPRGRPPPPLGAGSPRRVGPPRPGANAPRPRDGRSSSRDNGFGRRWNPSSSESKEGSRGAIERPPPRPRPPPREMDALPRARPFEVPR